MISGRKMAESVGRIELEGLMEVNASRVYSIVLKNLYRSVLFELSFREMI